MKTTSLPFRTPSARQLGLWVLRAFSPAFGRGRFFDGEHYADYDIATFLGLPASALDEPKADLLPRLDAMLAKLENGRPASRLGPVAEANLSKLAKLLELNATETALLAYGVRAAAESVLSDTHYVLRHLIAAQPVRYHAVVLKLPRAAVAKALAPAGRLRTSGLIDHSDGTLSLASKDLAVALLHHPLDGGAILRQFCTAAPPARLAAADYPHLQPSLGLLGDYLAAAVRKRKKGVNILLHGPPGTGKSELSRLLGEVAGAEVFEVATEDAEGVSLAAASRLRSLNGAQHLFRGRRAIFVLDEAEDILTPANESVRSTAARMKGWFNKRLEENRVPVIWISNSIEDLDPAFARRFDFILNVPVPPRGQRRRMLSAVAGSLAGGATLDRLADSEHLAPAVMARARDVVHALEGKLAPDRREEAFALLLSNTLQAQGHADPLRGGGRAFDPDVYDIGHLNTEADLRQIAEGLRGPASARLCLHGPPGTGKTAFAHWLAREIGLPLHAKKASELFGPYVGMTERRIARAFQDAASDGAVLLLDEVDSFLQDRSRATHSWEVTQINEMLTQMEAFPAS